MKRGNEAAQRQFKTNEDKGKDKIKIYSPSDYQKKNQESQEENKKDAKI